MTPSLTCLIIDPDRLATEELTRGLQNRCGARVLATATTVAGAIDGLYVLEDRSIDCLFIRIILWDDFLQRRSSWPQGPKSVIFLSAQGEKCTRHVPGEVDFHLQPPYQPGRLAAIFKRRADPAFQPRSLDFFFLKVLCRFHAIYFSSLLEVHGNRGWLRIKTDDQEYMVAGTLAEFERRLTIPCHRVGRHLLLTHY